MLIKFLICSTLACFAVADVQLLSRAYLPPSKQETVIKFDISPDAIDVSNKEIVTNDLKPHNPESLTKKTNNDPAYSNFPISNNGFPAGFPNQAYPAPGYPSSVFPPHHGLTPLGFPRPGLPPTPGFIGPGYPQPGYPQQLYPGQSYPGHGYPGHGYPGHGYPGHGYPAHGYPGHGYPGHSFVNPLYPLPGQPMYPVYFSQPEKLKGEKENEDDKLRVRVFNSGTEYDKPNDGYLYQKPAVTF